MTSASALIRLKLFVSLYSLTMGCVDMRLCHQPQTTDTGLKGPGTTSLTLFSHGFLLFYSCKHKRCHVYVSVSRECFPFSHSIEKIPVFIKSSRTYLGRHGSPTILGLCCLAGRQRRPGNQSCVVSSRSSWEGRFK